MWNTHVIIFSPPNNSKKMVLLSSFDRSENCNNLPNLTSFTSGRIFGPRLQVKHESLPVFPTKLLIFLKNHSSHFISSGSMNPPPIIYSKCLTWSIPPWLFGTTWLDQYLKETTPCSLGVFHSFLSCLCLRQNISWHVLLPPISTMFKSCPLLKVFPECHIVEII